MGSEKFAIPRLLLNDAATLKKPRQTDVYGQSVYDEIALLYVRVEMQLSQKNSDIAKLDESGGVLYFDSVNSLPKGTIFGLDDVLNIAGKDYKVTKIEQVKAQQVAHQKLYFTAER